MQICAGLMDEFRERFPAHAATLLTPADFIKTVDIDAEIDFREIDDASVKQILSLAPFGFGNPCPLFVARNLDSKIHSDLSLSSWRVTDDGYIQIIWSTRFDGYGIQLSRSKGSFRGTAHYWTDIDPKPIDPFAIGNSTAVQVDRVECRDSEK
jgi:hypothetical protein